MFKKITLLWIKPSYEANGLLGMGKILIIQFVKIIPIGLIVFVLLLTLCSLDLFLSALVGGEITAVITVGLTVGVCVLSLNHNKIHHA